MAVTGYSIWVEFVREILALQNSDSSETTCEYVAINDYYFATFSRPFPGPLGAGCSLLANHS
jgi:hypothetical protein